MSTEMPEIEDAQCSKSMAPPPPTAQTPGSNWLIFVRDGIHSVADYNSTLMGVVVVVVVVVVRIFTMG